MLLGFLLFSNCVYANVLDTDIGKMSKTERAAFLNGLHLEGDMFFKFKSVLPKWLNICEEKNDQLSKVRLLYKKYLERDSFKFTFEEEKKLLEEGINISEDNAYHAEKILFSHYYQFFHYYKEGKNIEKLYVYLLQEFEEIKKVGYENFTPYDLSKILQHNGKIFYDLLDYDNALNVLKVSEKYAPVKYTYEYLYNLMGILSVSQAIYKNNKNYDSGLEYAHKIRAITEKCYKENTYCYFWQGLSSLDIAEMLMSQNKINEGEIYAAKGYDLIKNTPPFQHDGEAEYDALNVMIKIKFKLKKYDEIRPLLERQAELMKYEKRNEDFYFKQLSFYEHSAALAEYNGDYKSAVEYTKTAKVFSDSLEKRNDARKIEQLNQKNKIKILQSEISLIEKDKKINIWIRNATLLLLLLSGALFYIRYITLKTRQKAKEAELENSKRELEAITENFQQKSVLFEQMKTKMENIISEKDTQDYVEKLNTITLVKDEDWHHFKTTFEKVHPNFINGLKEKYEEITPAEIRVMVLEKLNFDLNAMANTLGISKQSVHKTKYRMKKKYGEEVVK